MDKPPANLGWAWIKDGIALFRKQPAEMCTLFLSYLFFMIAIGIIPLLGQVLPLILLPALSMAFLQACSNIEQDKRVYPSLLLNGFRSPAFITLLKLGVLYLGAAIIAVAASSVVDGGTFWKAMSGQLQLDAQTVQESNMTGAMLFAGALYLPAAMAFWYAAPLVAWQNMGVMKAVFYSFFAVSRHGKAFLVYGLAWATLGIFLPVILSSIIAVLAGTTVATLLVLLPMSVIMSAIMYCSFYASYTHVFGKPGDVPPARQESIEAGR